MSILSASILAKKYLMVPNPQTVLLWKLNAQDVVTHMQTVEYAFVRQAGRTRSGKPKEDFSKEVHLWREPLGGWGEVEVFDYVCVPLESTANGWVVKSVNKVLEGQLFICQMADSVIDTATQALIAANTSLTPSGNLAPVYYMKYDQVAPLAIWTINHNFGRYADVSVFTTGGVQILAEVIQMSVNQVQIRFDSPQSGYAILQ